MRLSGHRWLALVIGVSIVGLGLIGGIQSTWAKGAPTKSRFEELETAMQKAGIRPKQPREIPFAVKATRAAASELPGGRRVLQIDYIGETDWITVTTYRGDVNWVSGQYEIVDVDLGNGIKAQYMDNGEVQQLLWKDGDLTYHMAVGGTKREIADLIRIARSFAH